MSGARRAGRLTSRRRPLRKWLRVKMRLRPRLGQRLRLAHPRRTLALALVFGALAIWAARQAWQPGPWQRVYATREGDVGRRTSTGLLIRPDSMFVALPHKSALGKNVELRYGNRVLVVPVLDVGPWNIDDPYWQAGDRPAAERGRGFYRRPSNRAGIDLSDPVFAALGLRDNDFVEWRFVHRGYVLFPRL
jgi:hypothetical protein